MSRAFLAYLQWLILMNSEYLWNVDYVQMN